MPTARNYQQLVNSRQEQIQNSKHNFIKRDLEEKLPSQIFVVEKHQLGIPLNQRKVLVNQPNPSGLVGVEGGDGGGE